MDRSPPSRQKLRSCGCSVCCLSAWLQQRRQERSFSRCCFPVLASRSPACLPACLPCTSFPPWCRGAGLGIHHAGMVRSDRNLMERAFGQGLIKVSCPVSSSPGLLCPHLPPCWRLTPPPTPTNPTPTLPRTPAPCRAGAVLHRHSGLGRQPARPHRDHQGHAAVQPAEGRVHRPG